MAEQSEHHPENPPWTVKDLEDRWYVLYTYADQPEEEAQVCGHGTFNFLCKFMYKRYVELLEDIQKAVAAADADAKSGGSMAAEFRDEDDDGRDLMQALADLEANVLQDFNKDVLRDPLVRVAREGDDQPFQAEDTKRLESLRFLMADFRYLQDPGERLQPAYGRRLRPHYRWMQKFIDDCLPDAQDLWVDGDLVGHKDFEKCWTDFRALKTDGGIDENGNTVPNTDVENRRLVAESQNILQWAFDALLLKTKDAEMDWAYMQDPKLVPSYTIYAPYDPLFWEGAGQAEGARQLAINLGWDEDEATFQSHMGPDPSMGPDPFMMPADVRPMVATWAAMSAQEKEAFVEKQHMDQLTKNMIKSVEDVVAKVNNKRPPPENGTGAGGSALDRKRHKKEIQLKQAQKLHQHQSLIFHQTEPAKLDPQGEWTAETIQEALAGKLSDDDEKAPLEQLNNLQYDGTDEFYGDEDYDENEVEEVWYDSNPEDDPDLYDSDDDEDDDETYTIVDAINDMTNLRADAGLAYPVGDNTALVTPPARIKEETARSYRREWREFAEEYDDVWQYVLVLNKEHWDIVKKKKKSQQSRFVRRSIKTDAALNAVIARLEDTLLQEEAVLSSTRPENYKQGGEVMRLKAWRMTAWRTRYLRCLHLCLLAVAAGVTADHFNRVYDRRLQDLIEHERAWLAADRYALERLLKAAGPKREARQRIRDREENISEWEDLLKEAKQVTSGEKETEPPRKKKRTIQIKQSDFPIKLPFSKENKKTKAAAASPATIPSGPPRQPSKQKWANPPGFEQQLQKAQRALLNPNAAQQQQQQQPDDDDIEMENAPDSASPSSDKEKAKDDLAKYAVLMRDGPVLGSLVWDPNAPDADAPAADPRSAHKFARGGPPGYENLPTGTVYEKLQYMIILTLWRCAMATETRLGMKEDNKEYLNENGKL